MSIYTHCKDEMLPNLKATIDSTPPSNSVQTSIDSLHQSLNDLKKAAQRFSNALDSASTRNIDLSTDPPAASPTLNTKPESNRQDEADLTTNADSPVQDIQKSSPQVKTKPQLER